jgi:hypothetical protein
MPLRQPSQLVECFLHVISGIIKAVEVAIEGRRGRVRLGIIELLSLASELDSKLYQVSSLSLVAIL